MTTAQPPADSGPTDEPQHHTGHDLTDSGPGVPTELAPAPIANAPSGPQPAGLDRDERPLATPDRDLYLIGNAHLDCVWLWPWQEAYQEARATFWSVLHRMEEYDDFIFTCDQIVLLDWVREQDPELFAGIQQRVAEGRWVNTGGWWVEPDSNLPMGESFARQGLYGQRFLMEHFGLPATVGMNVDPFGHNVALPMILRAQGMDSYTFLRPGPHEANLPTIPFWWQSPDGSRVLAARIPNEYCSPRGDLSGQLAKGLGQLDTSEDIGMVFFGVGNHGGGPTRANLDSIRRYQRMGSFGRLVIASPREFFDEVLRRREPADGEEGLPTVTSDLQHHAAGCYSAHSGIKLWIHRAQHAMLAAERWAILADILDDGHNPALRYPREALGLAWKDVLFNQFHDLMPGSAIESGFDDARDQIGEAMTIAKRITALAHNTIARQVDIPLEEGTQPVVVFNHHPWPVTATVEMNYGDQPSGVHVAALDGGVVPSQPVHSMAATNDRSRGACAFTVELPPLGYRTYSLLPGAAPAVPAQHHDTVRVDGWVMENDRVRVEIDPDTGWLSSLLHKDSGVDPIAGGRGEHTVVCEDPTDTWGHHVVSYNWPGSSMDLLDITWRERGPVRARLRVERAWGRSRLVEEIILSAHADAVEVRAELVWLEQAHLLKLRVPVALQDPRATYEMPYAVIERPVDAAEEPGQAWVDLSGTVGGAAAGLLLVTTGKHGFDTAPAGHPADDDTASLGFTATRSAVYSWHDPKLLDGEDFHPYQDQGPQRFRYLVVPHAGDWRETEASRRGHELGQPPRAQLESFHDGALPTAGSLVSADGVLVTAVKGSEDEGAEGADLVVRAAEMRGEEVTATLDLPVVGRRLTATFTPWQVRTFRVPRNGRRAVVEVDMIEWRVDTPDAEVTSRRLDRSPRFAAGPLRMGPR